MSKIWALAVGAVAVQLLIVGCGSSSDEPGGGALPGTSTGTATTQTPSPEPAALRSFRYTLYTHCGIHFATFDGQVWATTPLSDGSANPPAEWGNPGQPGQVDILNKGKAVFTAPGLPPLVFHPTSEQPPMCD